jgi:hypothetical protein
MFLHLVIRLLIRETKSISDLSRIAMGNPIVELAWGVKASSPLAMKRKVIELKIDMLYMIVDYVQ